MLGVSPDYPVHVRREVLEKIDGPMLQHGLKEMHGAKIALPGVEGPVAGTGAAGSEV